MTVSFGPNSLSETRAVEAAEKARSNKVWLNAMDCINPSDRFAMELGRQILGWLNESERLLPPHHYDGALEGMRALTPTLYLTVSKS